MTLIKPFILFSLAFSYAFAAPESSAKSAHATEWAALQQKVETQRQKLKGLIEAGQNQGIETNYAEVSLETITTFQKAAAKDFNSTERVRRIFQKFPYHKMTDPQAPEKLPFQELNDCLKVADFAIHELTQQLEGKMQLSSPPDFAEAKVKLGPGYYLLKERPVFPYSLVWNQHDEGFLQSFGRIGQQHYNLRHLERDGTIDYRDLRNNKRSIQRNDERNLSPNVFFMGHSHAGWMLRKHPEISEGARHFTRYDIDSPLVRKWITQLCAALLPKLKASDDLPRLHLLANEPHFATQQQGWKAQNGLSDYTMEKYHRWLEKKYSNIKQLNKSYGSHFKDFSDVSFFIPPQPEHQGDNAFRGRQMDPKYRGSAAWYDWCRFNMDRVNEWFTFLKAQVQKYDGISAPVTIKTLGYSISRNTRDGGIDIEYLTKLQEVPGADLRSVPLGATIYGKHEEGMDARTEWTSHFAYDWVEQALFLDFTKSLCPDRVFYDSEWHGFSGVGWRHFNMKRDYVRSALWMAFSDGMGMINPWLWGRRGNGAFNEGADHIGELSTQPIAVDAYGRTMKELNAHAEWLAPGVQQKRHFLIYYCEESAIQDEHYTNGLIETYQALKLLNFSVGFTTPTEIISNNPNEQSIIVPPTPFISDTHFTRLKDYQKAGGKLLIIEAENNFSKDELGQAQSNRNLKSSLTSVPFSKSFDMMPALERILRPLAPQAEVTITIKDSDGNKATGVIAKQIKHPTTGKTIVLLNNISKENRVVTFSPSSSQSSELIDIITQEKISTTIQLPPCKVHAIGGFN